MPNNTRQSDRRRESTRRTRRFASEALHDRRVEVLENRCLLTVAINEFGGSVAPTQPFGITSGPDGNLYFTEASPTGGSIDRLSPSGSIERFTAGLSQFSIPTGITLGPDGNLWFTEFGAQSLGSPFGASAIGRFNPVDGQITEFSTGLTPASGPDQITVGPDNNLWFTENNGDRIGRITLQGNITEFRMGLTANSQPVGITAGPDGALWFAESNTDLIGRITTSGIITEFGQGVITRNSSPTGITLGSDGNLWFTEIGSSSSPAGGIGRITPQGAITQFTQGLTVAAGPAGITSGPDGALFFTEQNTGRIGRIDTLGGITEFTQGYAPTNAPAEITQGPDGNLWFTELGSFTNPGTHVDRITTAGVVTQFPTKQALPSNADPVGITGGPDGALWFTELGVNAIGRIDTSGQITQFTSGITVGQPHKITQGPDGALWFTEVSGAIGRITTQGVVTEFTNGLTVGGTIASPNAITLGPDGNLWFTEDNINSVAKITPQGVITQFSMGIGPRGNPQGITTGPDGNLWFTVDRGSMVQGTVDRITLAGVVTEFPIPMRNAGPTDIAAGPGNSLYFTENLGGRIGRVNATTGVVTELSPPGFLNEPNGIVDGPDNLVYFVEFQGNTVDRLNADGSFTTIPIPSNSSGPLIMAVGSDKNLWFTESFTSRNPTPTNAQIGQVILPQSSVFAIGAQELSPPAGQSFTSFFATFTDKSPAAIVTNFAALINFGDGTPTVPGVVTANGNGGFSVTGTHTYSNLGGSQGGVLVGTVTIFNQAGQIATSFSVILGGTPSLSFVVTNTNDSGPGSLRQAILDADQFQSTASPTTKPPVITFAIPDSNGSIQDIRIASPLPVITGSNITIDGATEASFLKSTVTTPLIQIDGTKSSPPSGGLVFASAFGNLFTISIFGFKGSQVELDSVFDSIRGNYIGFAASSPFSSSANSTAASNPGSDGLLVKATNAMIGGIDPGQRNVISGNLGNGIEFAGVGSGSSTVVGNYIGTDPTGEAALPNKINGIVIGNGANSVSVAQGNVISGNGDNGIELLSSARNPITGNFIGTDASGMKALGNTGAGICVDLGSSNNSIGGTIGASNIISGNLSVGVAVRGASFNNMIAANLIGTNKAGTDAVGNGIAGVLISDSPMNVVGPSNVISGNGSVAQGAGVWIDGPGSRNNKVFGNFIGTDLTGEHAIGNAIIGVLVNEGMNNAIGGSFAGATNVISGNTLIGVMLAGAGATGNLVAGNLIGTDAQGLHALGNGRSGDGAGVYLENAPTNFIGGSMIGMGNVISGNGFDGVQVFGSGSTGNLFQGNKIGTDFSGTLPLGNGSNGILINDAPGTQIVANLISANQLNGIMISGAGSSNTLIQGNVIGAGIGGQALGNSSFGLLVGNGAPGAIGSGNIIVNNTNGPIRDTNVSPAASTPSTLMIASKASTKKVSPKSASFGSRHLKSLQGRGHSKAKPHR